MPIVSSNRGGGWDGGGPVMAYPPSYQRGYGHGEGRVPPPYDPAAPAPQPAQYFLPENLLSFEPDYGQQKGGWGYDYHGPKRSMQGKGGDGKNVWTPLAPPPPSRHTAEKWHTAEIVKSQNSEQSTDTPSGSADSDDRVKLHASMRSEPSLSRNSAAMESRARDAEEYGGSTESYQLHQGDSLANEAGAKWHVNAGQVGTLSDCGHYFIKDTVAPLKQTSAGYLPPLCMLFERSLRFRGVHEYNYQIYEGEVGPAGGVGFVFDTRIRRRNIQKMRSIFLNARGQVCLRNEEKITKLPTRLPFIAAGSVVRLRVDLSQAHATFQSWTPGKDEGWSSTVEVDFTDNFEDDFGETMQTGFFCAIVTNRVSVSLF